MYTLEIGFYATTTRAFFESREDAERELAALIPKLGQEYRIRNDRDDTHTITTPSGPLVVVPSRVESARVIDSDVWAAQAAIVFEPQIVDQARMAGAIERAKLQAAREV